MTEMGVGSSTTTYRHDAQSVRSRLDRAMGALDSAATSLATKVSDLETRLAPLMREATDTALPATDDIREPSGPTTTSIYGAADHLTRLDDRIGDLLSRLDV